MKSAEFSENLINKVYHRNGFIYNNHNKCDEETSK